MSQSPEPLLPVGVHRLHGDLVEHAGQLWRLRNGNVQGEFVLVNGIGERIRLVGVRKAADLFGLSEADIHAWIDAGRARSILVDGVLLMQVHLSETGQLTLLT